MGFFSELKEDLSQAVSELLPEENRENVSAIPSNAEDLEELLEQMEADNLLVDELDDLPIDTKEEQIIEAGSYFASVLEQEEKTADTGGSLEESVQEGQPEETGLETPATKDTVPEEEMKMQEPGLEGVIEEQTAADAEYQETYSEEKSEITTESKEDTSDSEMLDNNLVNEEAAKELQENEEETKSMKMETENFENENTVEEAAETVNSVDENNKDNGGFSEMDSQLANKTAVDETAVITAGMTIQGDIISEGSMEVTGTIIGNIDILGKLNITGAVQGNSKAAEVYCENAKITGEIASEGSVKIGQSTVIIGNISANSAVIAGAVKGDIDVHGPVVLDTSAIVMGNIKSKSVQINNGAVIEGMCSQCYADVNPSSFFEDFKVIGKKGNK